MQEQPGSQTSLRPTSSDQRPERRSDLWKDSQIQALFIIKSLLQCLAWGQVSVKRDMWGHGGDRSPAGRWQGWGRERQLGCRGSRSGGGGPKESQEVSPITRSCSDLGPHCPQDSSFFVRVLCRCHQLPTEGQTHHVKIHAMCSFKKRCHNACGTYIQWNITQPLKRVKSCHLQQHGWT